VEDELFQESKLVSSIQTYATHLISGDLLQVAFDGCRSFAFPNCGGLLVVFPAANFGENTGFFTGTFETSQGDIEGLVFFQANSWQYVLQDG